MNPARLFMVYMRTCPLWILVHSVGLHAAEGNVQEFRQTLGDVETVSIATGRTQPLRTAPAVASVFTAEDLRTSGARDLIDILNQVPGFYVGRTVILWDPVLSVRGFSSVFNQNILFLLDGVPQTDIVFGDRRTALGTVPLDLIERVEVIRGPGSALYGADAYAAVVNVITRTTAEQAPQLTVSAGTHDTVDVHGLASGTWTGVDVVGAFEYRETDQHRPWIGRDQQTRLDELFGTEASLAPGRANTRREEWGAQLNLTGHDTTLGLRASGWRDVGLGTGTAGALDPFGSTDTTTVAATVRHQEDLTENWRLTGTLDGRLFRFAFNDLHFFPPGAFGVFPDGVVLDTEFEERFGRLQGVFDYTGLPDHTLSLGVGGELGEARLRGEQRNYTLVEGNILPNDPTQDTRGALGLSNEATSRDLAFAYLQDVWRLHPDWTLTWGLRYDRYSDFGNTLNPRAVLVWNARHDLTAKLLYGRGFRAPTLLETRAEQIPAIRADLELQPKKVDTVELAIDYRPRLDVQTRLSLWYHETEDQIRQQNTGGPDFRPENLGQQRGHGLDLEAAWDITPQTRLSGYYAYQDNTDDTTGEDAGYTPHHKLFGQLQHEYRHWLFSLRATGIGERDRIAEDTRPEADRYTLVDLLTRYTFSPHLEASLDIRNLFDEDAEDGGLGTAFPGDIPLPGRTYYFSIRGRF
jgi:iron complex outermembrane receptor protein